MWTVALPVCPRCDLKDDTARFVPSTRIAHVKLTLRGFSLSFGKARARRKAKHDADPINCVHGNQT